jgi:hypothetical protein
MQLLRMNRNIKVGQLIYVPSSVHMLKFGAPGEAMNGRRTHSVPEKHSTTEKPINLLVTAVQDDHIGVHYLGETWYVKQKDVYDI